MKGLGIAAKWLFILALPPLLVSATIAFEFNGLWLYKDGFQKYAVSQTTGLAKVELETAAEGLINYFNSDEEYISLTVEKDGEPFELFNQREIAHLKDVKGLFWLDYWVLLGTLIYTLSYAGVSLWWRRNKYWRRLAWGTVGGSGITLALMLALGIGTLLGFDQLFLQFHLISFTNEFWSTEGYMLLLFPRDFWYDTTIFCGGITAGLAVILGAVAGGCLLFTRKGANP